MTLTLRRSPEERSRSSTAPFDPCMPYESPMQFLAEQVSAQQGSQCKPSHNPSHRWPHYKRNWDKDTSVPQPPQIDCIIRNEYPCENRKTC